MEAWQRIDKINELLEEAAKLARPLKCLGKTGQERCVTRRGDTDSRCGHCQLRIETKQLHELSGIVKQEDHASKPSR